MEIGVLCYLLRRGEFGNTEICLATKKKKVGAGLLNGYGGHIENKETAQQAVIREVSQEAGVEIFEKGLEQIGRMSCWERVEKRLHLKNVTASHLLCWHIDIFVATSWSEFRWNGFPKETKEMGKPYWFRPEEVPYEKMMPADRFILPSLLSGAKCGAEVYYGVDKKTLEHVVINPWK